MKDIIKNQKLFFISLIGIVVVSLIMGTTYAYQTLEVDYKEGSTPNIGGEGLQTPKLEVNFNVTCKEGKTCDENNDNYNRINLTNMPLLKDYKTADYIEFTLTDNSTSDVAYQINLTDVIYSANLVTSDFKFTITEIVDIGEQVKYEGDFSTLSSGDFNLMPYTHLNKNTTKTIRVYFWLKETELEQNILEKTSFKAKIEITSLFLRDAEILPKLNETIIANSQQAVTEVNSKRALYDATFDLNNITGISPPEQRILALAEDDYGTSYVFRGNVVDNYIEFAGFMWRIIRINGDGSIRLILEGTLDKVKREGRDDYAGGTSEFNLENWDDNAYVGYMSGLPYTTTDANRCLFLVGVTVVDKVNSYPSKELCEYNGGKWTTTAYEATHTNLLDSTMKTHIDKFYEDYIENDEYNYHYGKYLADSIFCVDKTLSADGVGVSKQYGYGSGAAYRTYYGAVGRLSISTGTQAKSVATPTLKCAKGATNDFSRFTVDVQNINGVKTNGDLKYPIAGLTSDELVIAGGFSKDSNPFYYLGDSYEKGLSSKIYWTITPYSYYSGYAFMSVIIENGAFINNTGVWDVYGFRPVINLKKDTLLANGTGSKSDPYVIAY